MLKKRKKRKESLGRSDRYPSDYGVRDHEKEEHEREPGSVVLPGNKGQGREGCNKAHDEKTGKRTAVTGSDRK